MLDSSSWTEYCSQYYQITQKQILSEPTELVIYGDKESLKRTSTATEPGNADVGRKVHNQTNIS